MSEQVDGYICFYTDHITNDFISIDDARYMPIEQILSILQAGVLGYPGNLLGIIDEKGNSLQFFVHPDGIIEMNLPVPEQFGSYIKQLDQLECYNLLRQACRYMAEVPVCEAEFTPWWVE